MLQPLALMLCYTALMVPSYCQNVNTTYNNPILSGWNSDPSCTFVPELDNTFFCTTSTFLVFPGIPVYASKDLQNWKLASHALSRPEQLPELSSRREASQGIFASTLRRHNGVFYLITAYVDDENAPKFLLFNTTDPYSSNWSQPVIVENLGSEIDPDLFWDDDGKFYVASAGGIYISEVDILTSAASETWRVWNGTGERNPEGPHIMKKERATDIHGPFEGYPGNPILTAKGTDEYFQTVGHADLFQDASGNWWTIALSTRSGPAWEIYPMGRETVLTPTTWADGGWPVIDTVRGALSGPLPSPNRDTLPPGRPVLDPDVVDFAPGSALSHNFVFWQPPRMRGSTTRFACRCRLPMMSPTSLLLRRSRSDSSDQKVLGSASPAIVSGGTGPFTGTLISVYSTSNGGNGSTPTYFGRWRYTPVAQEIAEGVFVPDLAE